MADAAVPKTEGYTPDNTKYQANTGRVMTYDLLA